jgi:predicted NAD-dependent protein-ADP-ribosyltransferase YbiA (DUF1768 family)
MRVTFKPGVVVLVPENVDEGENLALLGMEADGHVFQLIANGEEGAALRDLGPREDACREPINISHAIEERFRPISNLALTPFLLDGRMYQSVEGFWQGLKFDSERDRNRIAKLHGGEAKGAGDGAEFRTHFQYEGQEIRVGSPEHWGLMRRACKAKFTTNFEAQEALLATGQRWLTHRMRRDSRNIPGAILAEIWMDIRETLRE